MSADATFCFLGEMLEDTGSPQPERGLSRGLGPAEARSLPSGMAPGKALAPASSALNSLLHDTEKLVWPL